MKLRTFQLSRLWSSAVVWSWAFNGLRLCSFLLLLPLLANRLDESDFGFYFVLLNLVALVPLLDLGFLSAISRSISYAASGATSLREHGMEQIEHVEKKPNHLLLWRLVYATRSLYRCLSLGVLIVMGVWGTLIAGLKIHETSNPTYAWLAWVLTLLGAVFDMYSGWWNTYLRGLNQVLISSRILVFVYVVRIFFACTLLVSGGGLLSVPIAGLASSFLLRFLSRRYALRFLGEPPGSGASKGEVMELVKTLWPNSWRVGVHCLSNYLTSHINTILCLQFFGLTATGQYGLSLQIVGIFHGMASVWIQVKWPVIGQYLVRRDYRPLRTILQHRILAQLFTFLLMAITVIPMAPWLLQVLNTGKDILPLMLMVLLAANALFETHLTSWTTFISIGNQLPFLSATVFTNLACLMISTLLILESDLGIGALVIGPLVANLAYNYWRWPMYGAGMVQSRWTKLMFSRSE